MYGNKKPSFYVDRFIYIHNNLCYISKSIIIWYTLYHVMPCLTAARHVMLHCYSYLPVTSRHVMSYHLSFHFMPCHITSMEFIMKNSIFQLVESFMLINLSGRMRHYSSGTLLFILECLN